MKVIIELEVEGLGKALRRAREEADLSVTAAGKLASMSGANFNRIENEETKGVPLSSLARAAKAVGLDLSAYMGDWIKLIPGIDFFHLE